MVLLRIEQSQRLAYLAGLLLAAAGIAQAHHSTAPCDLLHATVIQGTVTRFDLINPHGTIFLDVRGANEIEHWTAAIEGRGALRRLGWTKDSLQAGDVIVVTGNRARDGTFHMRALKIRLPDGHELLAVAP